MTTSEATDLTAADIAWDLPAAPAWSTDDPLVDALVEALAYRTLAQQAIHQLHDRHRTIHRLTEERNRLRDESRALRAELRARRVSP